jgi:DNA-binding response OmpR family regulator
MAGKSTILLVDDEPNITQLAAMYLQREGFATHAVTDGHQAMDAVKTRTPALIVLDIMLPGLDGFEVCRRLRNQDIDTPIIMLTARDDDIDKIVGLEMGADDYLTKPFNPRELVARVKAILRRSDRKASPEQSPSKPLVLGNLLIDPLRREVHADDTPISLRTQEFELLLVFARQPGIVLTREQLLQQAWGYDFFGQTRTVDVHVAHLRKKLPPETAQIETVTGVGYKLTI